MDYITLLRTDSTNEDYQRLIISLDKSLAVTDGEEHAFYDQFNKSTDIKHVIVYYLGGEAIACGAIKQFDDTTMELKRMYTEPFMRGKGVGAKIVETLEQWAQELGFERCILETGLRQQDAIALYKKVGYTIIPNYGQYIGIENSVCFEKVFQHN